MKGVQAACPSCGGPVVFKISSSLVGVCEFCRTVVARGDRKLEDHGKVAALVDTASPLHVGLRGKFGRKRFDIVGRVQFQHPAGGVWDEWYLAFSTGKWGWLAEAQGKMYLTFERSVSDADRLPEWEELDVGREFTLGSAGKLKVAELGRTRPLGAEGELPFQLEPNREHNFADLAGPEGVFGTFDFSTSPPTVYLGQQVTLDDLGLSKALAAEVAHKQIAALKVACPQCGGALELMAPDDAQRVTCPFCSAMLDADKGNLSYLKTLKHGAVHPIIPIGTKGELNGVEYVVIGFVKRSVTFDLTYYWSEYLLYNREIGFRWLIHSDQHWSFAEPVSIGDVSLVGMTAVHDGRTYRLFQRAAATVEFVLGEFYWKVEEGETVYARDFISPPYSMTVERTKLDEEQVEGDVVVARANAEINATKATYLPHEEVEKAFGVENLSRGWKVAPNQPNPVDNMVFAWWGVFAALLIVLDVIFLSGLTKEKVDQGMFFWAMVFVSIVPIGTLVYRLMFESTRWKDSEFNPYATE